jgi:hypothetical protein
MRFILSLLATANAYLATPDAFISAKDGHCVSGKSNLLELGCRALNGETSSDSVSRAQIEEFLAQELDEEEVNELLTALGLSGEDFACSELCTAEVKRNHEWLPWTTETGCVGGEGAIQCDVDLAFDSLRELKFTENGERQEVVQDEGMAKVDEDPKEVRMRRAERMLLRAFRSFPFSQISAEFDEEASKNLEAESIEVPAMMSRQTETALEEAVAVQTEAFLQQKQAAPSFLQTKQALASTAWSMACLHHADFRANSGLCPSFVDTESVFLQMNRGALPKGGSFLQEAEGCLATCSLIGSHAVGPNGCESCEAFIEAKAAEKLAGPSFVALKAGDWRTDVAKVSLKAQSYLEKVAQGMSRNLYAREMNLWYGTDDASTRTEVKRILASVSSMIDNVDYVYPGPQCSPNTYAYVYPNAGRGYTFDQKTGKKFNFFLCPYYMKVDLGEQIETLTHEGSHHRTAYTDDVPHPTQSGQKAYGRSSCKTLARYNKRSALKNADSFCYFTQDAAESPESASISGSLPAPAPTTTTTTTTSKKPTYSYPSSGGSYGYRPTYGGSSYGYRPTYGGSSYGGSSYGGSSYGGSSYGGSSYSNPSRPYPKPWQQR